MNKHKCGNCGKYFVCLAVSCPSISDYQNNEKSTCNCEPCGGGCKTRPFILPKRKKGTFIGERVYQ